MVVLIYKLLAISIVCMLIPNAFNPRYRYNEHCKWEPELVEILTMCFLGMLVVGAILIKS